MKYKMIEKYNLKEFNDEVNKMIENGWTLRNDGNYDFTPTDYRDWGTVYWASFIKLNDELAIQMLRSIVNMEPKG